MLWIVLLAAASPAAEPPAIITAFMTLCHPGSGPADALARATAKGWEGKGADRTTIADGMPLTLHASDTDAHGERVQSCGIRATAPVPTIATAARTALGFAPMLDLHTSATFFALGDRQGWRSGVALDHAQFAAAKSQGRFYSIVAATDDAGATIYATRAIEQPRRP